MIKKIYFGSPVHIGKKQYPSMHHDEVAKHNHKVFGDRVVFEDKDSNEKVTVWSSNIKYMVENLVEENEHSEQESDEFRLAIKHKDDPIAVQADLQKQDAQKRKKRGA